MSDGKLRAVCMADGRIGWPDVVEYQLEDGTRLPVPPRPDKHPDWGRWRPVPLSSTMVAKQRAEGTLVEAKVQGLPYRIIVHDRPVYDRMCATGLMYSSVHRGISAPMMDNRKTP